MITPAQNTYQILAAQNKRYNLMFTLKRDTTAQNTPARPTAPKIKAHDTSSNLIPEAK